MHVEPEPAVEQHIGDEQPVRGDDNRVRRDFGALVQLGGLRDGNPEPLGCFLGGVGASLRRRPRLVGTREQQRDLVIGGEALEDVGAEGAAAVTAIRPQPRTMRGRSLPSARGAPQASCGRSSGRRRDGRSPCRAARA
jgi:hypothetical protein